MTRCRDGIHRIHIRGDRSRSIGGAISMERGQFVGVAWRFTAKVLLLLLLLLVMMVVVMVVMLLVK